MHTKDLRLDTPTSWLSFPTRTFNGLRAGDIDTFADVMELSPRDFARFRNVGKNSVNDLILFQDRHKDVYEELKKADETFIETLYDFASLRVEIVKAAVTGILQDSEAVLTPDDVAERKVQEEWDKNSERLRTDFTLQEQIRICFIPLIIENMIWHYADECQQYGRDHRIDVLKKLSRAVTHIRQEYDTTIRQSLDDAHQGQIKAETERFVAMCGNDFVIMYHTMWREYRKIQPESDIAELASKAIIGMLLVKFLDAWNKHLDGLIAERFGEVKGSIRTPTMDKLYACFDAYAGHIEGFNWKSPDIGRCMTILHHKINKIEFQVGED